MDLLTFFLLLNWKNHGFDSSENMIQFIHVYLKLLWTHDGCINLVKDTVKTVIL